MLLITLLKQSATHFHLYIIRYVFVLVRCLKNRLILSLQVKSVSRCISRQRRSHNKPNNNNPHQKRCTGKSLLSFHPLSRHLLFAALPRVKWSVKASAAIRLLNQKHRWTNFLKANYNYAESGNRMRVSVCVGEWERIRTELDDFITKPFCLRLTDVWCTKKSVKVGTKYNVSTRGINVKTDFRIQ